MMSSLCWAVCAVAVAVVIAVVEVDAYSSGAGSGACSEGVPGGTGSTTHGSLQSGDGGFSLVFSPALASGNEFVPSTTYDVTLMRTTNTYGGFLVLADGGSFTPGTNNKNGPCGQPSLTHSQFLSMDVSFQWTSPASGSVMFRTTTLVNREGISGKYWIFNTELTSGLDCSSVPQDCASINRIACDQGNTTNTCGVCNDGYFESSGENVPKNTDSCQVCNETCSRCVDATNACIECASGYTKEGLVCLPNAAKNFTLGSKLVTVGCDPDVEPCDVVAEWGREGLIMNFRITVLNSPSTEWAAIGFSSSPSMPNSDILTAFINDNGQVDVVNRWASSRSRPVADSDQSGISGVEGMRNSSHFVVEFSRTLSPINSNDASFLPGADSLYVIVAHGPNDVSIHAVAGSNAPFVSSSAVDLRASAAVSSSETNKVRLGTSIHGIIMVSAWLLFAPSATLIAHTLRFYVPLWFKLHRNLQTFVVLLTLGGFATIVQDVGELELDSNHATIGFVVVILCIIQAILGFARNFISKKDSNSTDPTDHGPRRWLFNYLHWVLGALSLVGGAVAVALGIQLYDGDSRTFPVFIAWAAVEAVAAILSLFVNGEERPRLATILVVAAILFTGACSVLIAVLIAFS
eukprot:m.83520 g.83520  ORF g.83520 m.83520 type:complete len:633 (-) comp12125_c0_seq1:303-2201(-)